MNLKCEDIGKICTPILTGTTDKFIIPNLPKGVELNSLSIHVNFSKVTIQNLVL